MAIFSFSSLQNVIKYHYVHFESFLVFATRRMCWPSSACCLQTGPLWMMFCVVSDCLVSYVMPTEAAATAGLSDNRLKHLNWPVSPLNLLHHTLLAQGRNFLVLFFTIQLIQQLDSKAAFNSNSETHRACNLLSMYRLKTQNLLLQNKSPPGWCVRPWACTRHEWLCRCFLCEPCWACWVCLWGRVDDQRECCRSTSLQRIVTSEQCCAFVVS